MQLRTIFALLVLVLRTPRFLTLWTGGRRHGLVATLSLVAVVVLVWWTDAGVVRAVVDLAARAAGLAVSLEDGEGWVGGDADGKHGKGED